MTSMDASVFIRLTHAAQPDMPADVRAPAMAGALARVEELLGPQADPQGRQHATAIVLESGLPALARAALAPLLAHGLGVQEAAHGPYFAWGGPAHPDGGALLRALGTASARVRTMGGNGAALLAEILLYHLDEDPDPMLVQALHALCLVEDAAFWTPAHPAVVPVLVDARLSKRAELPHSDAQAALDARLAQVLPLDASLDRWEQTLPPPLPPPPSMPA